jgi:CPA1 family monovalent cation:H+ antiporter
LRDALATLDGDRSPVAETVRQEFTAYLTSPVPPPGDERGPGHIDLHHRALEAARQAVLAMRATDEIGDDAFHQIEEELDWLDMADGAGKQ